MKRAVEIAGFLAQNGWDSATQEVFDADFSPRHYARLLMPDGRRAILMDADPDQKTNQFVILAQHLQSVDVAAPTIFAAQPHLGLVLMEDFGDRNLGGLLDAGDNAPHLYQRAVDVLIRVHQADHKEFLATSSLPVFNDRLFAAQLDLFISHAFVELTGRVATESEAASFNQIWMDLLSETNTLPQTLMLRDFMPDNLMDLSDGRLGVLDFQDGGLGPNVYDVASLLECVRRDCGEALRQNICDYYLRRQPYTTSSLDFNRAIEILRAQRHLRIFGILLRLARTRRVANSGYIARVRCEIDRLVKMESLACLRGWFDQCGIRH